MEKLFKKISIIGAGTWGIAIASHLEPKAIIEVTHYRSSFLDSLDKDRIHPHLSSFRISKNIFFKSRVSPDSNLLVVASPVQYIRKVLAGIDVPSNVPMLILSKGIEKKTLMFPLDIIKDILDINDKDMAILSGPSHAEEVVSKNPTSVVISSASKSLQKSLQGLISDKYFRVYCNEDVVGVQLGGAVKNVISIASGIVSGLGYGDNTVSALLTRGIYELKSLGIKLGAKKETLNGLAGLGDLMATSFSNHSRNRYVGTRIGQGESLKTILSDLKMSAEGVETAKSLKDLSESIKVPLPICDKVYDILFLEKDPRASIDELMLRNLRDEF